jgi:hypothetical protein
MKMYIEHFLGISKGGFDFSRPCDGTRNGHLFFMRPLAHTDFDMPGVE